MTAVPKPQGSPPPQTKPPAPSPKLSKLETILLEKVWGRVKPGLVTAGEAAKTKLLAALDGKPLLAIGAIVGAVDMFLLKGPKPRSTQATSFLTDTRKFLGDAQLTIDRILAPPKPITDKSRKLLAGVVTLAGFVGVYKVAKDQAKP